MTKENSEDKNFKFQGTGLTSKEKYVGGKRFKEYLKIFPHLDKISTLQLLEDLVFLEIIQERYKSKIAEITSAKPSKKANEVPSTLMEVLSENLEKIIKLKEKLGLFESKDKLDAYKDIDNLKKKFEVYRKNNPLSFKTTCPFCKEIYFMKRQTKDYEPYITPFFENKILVNRPLFKLYHEGKIQKKDVAAVLGVSEDYVNWIEEEILNKIKSA